MNIFVNNTQQKLTEHASIQDALDAMNIPSVKGIAIAINNNVIPKAEWDNYTLAENDKVTVIKATQGG